MCFKGTYTNGQCNIISYLYCKCTDKDDPANKVRYRRYIKYCLTTALVSDSRLSSLVLTLIKYKKYVIYNLFNY